MKIKGIYLLYRVLQAFGLPVVLLYLALRGVRNAAYWRSLPQRFGFLPRPFRQTSPGAIWLHAVSVGEILACVELLRRLRGEFPRSGLFVSTSTLAGRATADQKLKGLADGVFYAPLDYAFAVRRVLRALRPAVVAIAETEIWPNLIREAKRTGAGVTIFNARISDRAFPKYLRLRPFFEAVLPAVDSVLAQTDEIRERFIMLGSPADRVRTAGNLKYDFEARPAQQGAPVPVFLERSAPGSVWIAASTMPPAEPGDVDEDDVVISAFKQVAERRRDLMLLIAPRKPERFEAVARKLEAAGIRYTRRSRLENGAPPPLPHVLLLDTIGELSGLFPAADVVFMGGTLARRGGHNILEPALFGKPVIMGPNMQNFQAVAEQFRARQACVEIAGPEELASAVERLLASPELARDVGRRALAEAEARRGASTRVLEEIRRLYDQGVPRYRPAMPWFALARVLARIWAHESRRRMARASRRRRTLDVAVIAVGNITMGGTGKTPFVLRLAELLRERGRKPGILTRGYGRSSPQRELAIAPGAEVSADRSGDEPQIFVRSGLAPVGIGADRYTVGRLLRREFDVDVMLLDDGFQHVRLARDLDIVLVDALEPFGRGDVFPVGRLREPVSGLARANAVVITRSQFTDLAPAIRATVRAANPRAPIFNASVRPRGWVNHRTGESAPLPAQPFQRPGAFCGLGNPQSFRRTLESIGLRPVDWVEFEDHHRYRPHELRRIAEQALARGADTLVTTEKDAVNLCDGWQDLLAPLPLHWLRVTMAIEDEDRLMDVISRALD